MIAVTKFIIMIFHINGMPCVSSPYKSGRKWDFIVVISLKIGPMHCNWYLILAVFLGRV